MTIKPSEGNSKRSLLERLAEALEDAGLSETERLWRAIGDLDRRLKVMEADTNTRRSVRIGSESLRAPAHGSSQPTSAS